MAKLLKGKPIADEIKENLKMEIKNLSDKAITPTLGIIQIGEQEDNLFYQQNIIKCCKALGICVCNITLPVNYTQSIFDGAVGYMGYDRNIHGILILNPFPKKINYNYAYNAISPIKDIDGITGESIFNLLKNSPEKLFLPCTAEACLRLLQKCIFLSGKNIVVIGRSLTVGKPLSLMLQAENATVTMCHSHTYNLDKICKNADIIISAAGQKGLIGASAVHEDQIIIDVGMNWDEEKGKFVGDVIFDEVEPIVAAITPVPGGIGSITTAILAEHVVEAAKESFSFRTEMKGLIND